jgi:hypothetical protein
MSAQAGSYETGNNGAWSPLSELARRLDLTGKIFLIRAKISRICKRGLRELEKDPQGLSLVDAVDLRAFSKLLNHAIAAPHNAREKVFFAKIACGLIELSDEERAEYAALEREQEEAEQPRPKTENLASTQASEKEESSSPPTRPAYPPHEMGPWLRALKEEIAREKRRLYSLTRALRQLIASQKAAVPELDSGLWPESNPEETPELDLKTAPESNPEQAPELTSEQGPKSQPEQSPESSPERSLESSPRQAFVQVMSPTGIVRLVPVDEFFAELGIAPRQEKRENAPSRPPPGSG